MGLNFIIQILTFIWNMEYQNPNILSLNLQFKNNPFDFENNEK